MISELHNIYRNDRNRHGGGVIIGININYKSKQLDIKSKLFESVIVELFINQTKYILISIYIPPIPNTYQIIEFKELLKRINSEYSQHLVLICGDFNLNLLDMKKSIVRDFLNVLNETGFHQRVKTFTYPSDSKYATNKSILDLVIVNDKKFISNLEINDNISETCDHFLISIQMRVKISEIKVKHKIIYNYNNELDLTDFKRKISDINWDTIFDITLDINKIYDNMLNTIINIKNDIFKPKNVIQRNYNISYEIKSLIEQKRKLHKLYTKTNDKFYAFAYNHIYYKINNLLENFHSNRFENIINKSQNLKSLYNYIKSNNDSDKSNIFRTVDNCIVDNDLEICENFSNCFLSKYSSFSEPIILI